jgi:hypothetical protein
MPGQQLARKLFQHATSGRQQIVQLNGFHRHALELRLEHVRQRLLVRKQHFMGWPVVAREVEHEAVQQRVFPAMTVQHQLDVEQVPRMLAIHCRHQLAAVQLGIGKDRAWMSAANICWAAGVSERRVGPTTVPRKTKLTSTLTSEL